MINTTRDIWKMCQIALASAARAILAHFSNINKIIVYILHKALFGEIPH